MDINLDKNFTSLIDKAKEKRYFWEGLVAELGIVFALLYLFLGIVPSELKNNTYFSWSIFIIFSIATLIIVGAWKLRRRSPIFRQNEIGIIVAFNCIGESERYAKKLKETIAFQLRQDLGEIKYKIKVLPPNYQVTNDTEAGQLRKDTKAHLIIWGTINVAKDAQKGKAISLLDKHLRLTFKAARPFRTLFFSDAFSLFHTESTVYHEDNEYIEEPIMRKNISKTAKFILAKCLAIDSKYNNSLMILEKIKQEPVSEDYAKLLSIVNSNINLIRYNKIIEYYQKFIYVNGTFIENMDIIQELLQDIKLFKNPPNDILIIKAALQVLLLQFKEAEKTLKLVRASHPNDNSVHISFAFISLWRNNIDLAMKDFRKVKFEELDEGNISHILDFYAYFINKHPNKFSFLYGIAFVNMQCGGEMLAKEYFQKFVAHPKNNINHWKDQARKYIQECKNIVQGV